MKVNLFFAIVSHWFKNDYPRITTLTIFKYICFEPKSLKIKKK